MVLLQIFLEIFWLLLPVGIANSVPPIAAHYNWLPILNRPIDGGAHLGQQRILGDHKTIRGLVLGIIFGSITASAQYYLQTVPVIEGITMYSFGSLGSAAVFGVLMGFGALAGDAIKSFLKRRVNVPPGQPWRPFDQIDSIIGGIIVASFFLYISFLHIIVALISFGIIVFLVSLLGVFFHIKKTI